MPWGLVNPSTNPKHRAKLRRLHANDYSIHSQLPSVIWTPSSSIRNLRTRHAVVASTHLTRTSYISLIQVQHTIYRIQSNYSINFQSTYKLWSNIKTADRWGKNKRKSALRHAKYMASGLPESQSVIQKETKRISFGYSEGNTQRLPNCKISASGILAKQ